MANLFTWLALAIPGLISRLLFSFGIGLVSVAGTLAALTQLKTLLSSSYNGISTDLLGLLGLAGVDQALAYIIGAVIFRVTVANLEKRIALAKT
ncbi:MAG: DUF2523 family protein [Thiobacillaceae bacterium]